MIKQRLKNTPKPRPSCRRRFFNTDADLSYTYPKGSPVINSRHFYQNTILMDWYAQTPHPVSLRQLAFFGRKLTETKIISSANYVRQELPTRIAHRIRDMQIMPFAVVSNPNLCEVYEKYVMAFDRFRKFPNINTLEDNDRFCSVLSEQLDNHLTVIPHLVMGSIEASLTESIDPDRLDKFLNQMLCSRISRRVIAEQHLSISRTFASGVTNEDKDPSFIGAVFLQCSARQAVEEATAYSEKILAPLFPGIQMPTVVIEEANESCGDSFPYMKAHLDYIVGEIMRNSIEATLVNNPTKPIQVSISSTPETVLVRVSDQGGGVPNDVLPHIWSFAKGPRSQNRLTNFEKIPMLRGVSEEVSAGLGTQTSKSGNSLSPLLSRDPTLKLGLGLPLSRVYAEYWDGALDLRSLEGYGCDVLFRISRLGNQAEKLQLDKV